MSSKLKYILDPLDREVLDRAFDEAWAAVHAKANALIESGSDEELEALLRRELMEIASFNGLDEQIVQKILCDSGSIAEPGIGIGVLVSKTAGVGMPMLT